MSDGHELAEIKDIETATDQSIQDRARTERAPGLFFAMARAGQIIAPWWSPARDQDLRRFWRGLDFLSSAFYSIGARLGSVPFRVEPRDPAVKTHWRQAEQVEMMLQEETEFGAGWDKFWQRFLMDCWSCDNGGFGEVIGDGKPDGPIRGPVLGLANLDSIRCTRTRSTSPCHFSMNSCRCVHAASPCKATICV